MDTTEQTGDDATTGQLTAEAAELYERFFVPALFDQWPGRLLDLAGVGPGDRVLDVACGTGVVARAARARVGAAGSVTGVDVNEGMLAVAAREGPEVAWLPGRAEALPVPSDSFDAVVCQFGLMFFTDPAAAVTEMARVVRPGGAVVVATWAGLPETPGYAAMVDLLDDLLGAAAAGALTAPFTVGTPDALAAAVGDPLDDLEVRRLDGVARFDSIDAWVTTDVRAWTLRDLIDDEQLATLLDHARVRLAGFCDADGRVAFPAPALVAVGRG
ncbi:methyltransferase domain-containing protein [Nocardioides sp. YIM 152588]|uniref:class I SAM-dependent methyltransferase n=1 Tax=Nocardioides sp. YIM 152588 TaxID=3158259 RepID=UPI0032E459D2